MVKVPKPRSGSGSGKFGGDGGRGNRGSFRNSGGVVKPPSKSCALVLLVAGGSMILAAGTGATLVEYLI